MKKLLLVSLGLLIAYVLYILSSTGFFRNIENTDFTVTRSFDIVGAEDFAIDREEGFILISSDDRAAQFSDRERTGGIYWLDLKNSDARPKLISSDFNKPLFPHGISMFKIDSARYKLFVVNHVDKSHFIEVFLLEGDTLTYQKSLQDELLFSPNDVVAIDENRFYFTNDHLTDAGLGKFAANYLGKPDSNVGYYDGENFSIVADGIQYANGINFDPDRNLLYVAAVRAFGINVYQPNEDATLNFIESIDCGTGVDNIELDEKGTLWVGCHPDLLAAKAYLDGKSSESPSEVISIEYKSTGDYTIEQFYMEDGKTMAASTVAVPYKDEVFVGNVMDDDFIVIKK